MRDLTKLSRMNISHKSQHIYDTSSERRFTRLNKEFPQHRTDSRRTSSLIFRLGGINAGIDSNNKQKKKKKKKKLIRMYLSEASRGNRSTDLTPFSITVRMHTRTDWKFPFSPGQLQLGIDLQTKLSLRRQLMNLSPKYNDLGFGQGHGLVCLSLRTAC